MDDIAEVAEVSKPMIYAYLGSKDDLFTACIRREAQRLMESITAAVPTGAALTLATRLMDIAWTGLEHADRHHCP